MLISIPYNDLQDYVLKKMTFLGVIQKIDKDVVYISNIHVYGMIPISSMIIPIYDTEKFSNMRIGTIIKFNGELVPVLSGNGKWHYTICNIKIKSTRVTNKPRNNLSRLAYKYVMVEGIFDSRGSRYNENLNIQEKKNCITDVVINGTETVDHLWIDYSDEFKGVSVGATISFTGLVVKYNKCKKYLNGIPTGKKIRDYKIVNVKNIVFI